MFHNYLIILRPKHWIKNLLIFFPILFSPLQLESYAIQNSIIAFLLFCIAASSVYTFNDVMDYKKDKDNIRTQKRPIANGSISLNNGVYLSMALTILSCSLSLMFLPNLFLFLTGYIFLNILYSCVFKFIILFDVIFVSLGFLIRIVSGGIVTNIDQSIWTLLIIAFASLSMAIGKRLGQLVKNKNNLAASWNLFSLRFLLIITLIFTIISYITFSFDSEVIERHGNKYIWISILPFTMLFMRYFYISFTGRYMGDPTDAILKDRYLQILSLIWIIIIFFLIIL
tara:strand:+ start:1623 stop:2474 length:852 start_codon:yes stop_codon:yes gene_type:complete